MYNALCVGYCPVVIAHASAKLSTRAMAAAVLAIHALLEECSLAGAQLQPQSWLLVLQCCACNAVALAYSFAWPAHMPLGDIATKWGVFCCFVSHVTCVCLVGSSYVTGHSKGPVNHVLCAAARRHCGLE